MFTGLIVYSNIHPQLSVLADTIQTLFDGKKYAVRSVPANEAGIVDITAADILIFGSQEDSKGLVDGEYRELYRALQGINLAPRYAALFTIDSQEALSGMKAMLKDTNVTLYNTSLIYTYITGEKDSTVERWIEDIQTQFEDSIHERQF
jgi:hypothetical protein